MIPIHLLSLTSLAHASTLRSYPTPAEQFTSSDAVIEATVAAVHHVRLSDGFPLMMLSLRVAQPSVDGRELEDVVLGLPGGWTDEPHTEWFDAGFPLPEEGDVLLAFGTWNGAGVLQLAAGGPSLILNVGGHAADSEGNPIVALPCDLHPVKAFDVGRQPADFVPSDDTSRVYTPDPAAAALQWPAAVNAIRECGVTTLTSSHQNQNGAE